MTMIYLLVSEDILQKHSNGEKIEAEGSGSVGKLSKLDIEHWRSTYHLYDIL